MQNRNDVDYKRDLMDSSKLPSLEELLFKSLDPKSERQRLGLPHPLVHFTINGTVKDNAYSDALLSFMDDTALAETNTKKHQAAVWFLLRSERAFFLTCLEAGIDADKLRTHLLKNCAF